MPEITIRKRDVNPIEATPDGDRVVMRVRQEGVTDADTKTAMRRLLNRRTQIAALETQVNNQWDAATTTQKMVFLKTFMLGSMSVFADLIVVVVWLVMRDLSRR